MLARASVLMLGICLALAMLAQSQPGQSSDAVEKAASADSQSTVPGPSKAQAGPTPAGADQKLTPAEASLPKLNADTANPFKHLTDFSAVMVGSMLGDTNETHIYRHGNLLRTETSGVPIYYLTNLSTLEGTAVFPKRCLSGGGAHGNAFPFTFFHRDATFRREPLGEEAVDGHHCHIERIIRTSPDGSIARIKLLEADDLKGFPIKVELELGPRVNTITYKNVKLEPPDPAVFKHPTQCTAFGR